MRVFDYEFAQRTFGIGEHSQINGVRQQFMHDSKLLAVERLGERDNTRNIAARSIEACDQTLLHGVGSITENDRDCVGCILGRGQRPQLRAPESEPSPKPVPKGGTIYSIAKFWPST